jgi:hypothetical protein
MRLAALSALVHIASVYDQIQNGTHMTTLSTVRVTTYEILNILISDLFYFIMVLVYNLKVTFSLLFFLFFFFVSVL